jgi:hypothetical protein
LVRPISELGQFRKSGHAIATSALPSTADIAVLLRHVCLVPPEDIASPCPDCPTCPTCPSTTRNRLKLLGFTAGTAVGGTFGGCHCGLPWPNHAQRKDHEPLALGSLETYDDRIVGLISIPTDVLPPFLQMLIGERFKFVSMSGTIFHYRRARLLGFRLEMNLTGGDWYILAAGIVIASQDAPESAAGCSSGGISRHSMASR